MPVTQQTEISNAKSWTDAGATINTNLTYEHGVIAALEWVTGVTSTLPIQGRYDGVRTLQQDVNVEQTEQSQTTVQKTPSIL